METLTIGELAKRARVNRETVRYYERRRLLPRPSRSMSGYRIFSDDALRRLRFIRHAKALGFSLNEIKELLGLRVNSAAGCDRVRERTQVKIADIDQKIRALRQMKGALAGLVTACARRRRTNECPILVRLEANGRPERPGADRDDCAPNKPQDHEDDEGGSMIMRFAYEPHRG